MTERQFTVAVKEEWIQHLTVTAESAEDAISLVEGGDGEDAGFSEALSQTVIGIVEDN